MEPKIRPQDWQEFPKSHFEFGPIQRACEKEAIDSITVEHFFFFFFCLTKPSAVQMAGWHNPVGFCFLFYILGHFLLTLYIAFLFSL